MIMSKQNQPWAPMSNEILQNQFAHTPAFSPTLEDMRRIEQRARYERAKASREAFRYVAKKVSNLLVGERAADKVRIKSAC
jgi:hypothetical protein